MNVVLILSRLLERQTSALPTKIFTGDLHRKQMSAVQEYKKTWGLNME